MFFGIQNNKTAICCNLNDFSQKTPIIFVEFMKFNTFEFETATATIKATFFFINKMQKLPVAHNLVLVHGATKNFIFHFRQIITKRTKKFIKQKNLFDSQKSYQQFRLEHPFLNSFRVYNTRTDVQFSKILQIEKDNTKSKKKENELN